MFSKVKQSVSHFETMVKHYFYDGKVCPHISENMAIYVG